MCLSVLLVLGVSSQAVVTQEPSLSVIPGGTVTLTCSSSTGAVTSGHYPYWFQQKSGQVPRLLIYDTSSLVSGVPARFSGSLLGDKAALTIKGAQPEDEATTATLRWESQRPPAGGRQGSIALCLNFIRSPRESLVSRGSLSERC
uniref:Immunoglobulin V-set domain-containing protein n=1 Tax=Vombatus ursinus TaxID=29139 RepID=A0A4X2LDU5_VOMUR